jgi:hypothetical protein
MEDAHLGHFDVLLCWSIDRLSRGGVEERLESCADCAKAAYPCRAPWRR